jgi:hypothetical protein
MSRVSSGRRRSFLTCCASLLAFAATFILSCAAIGRFLPFPDVPVVRTKVAHFAAHHDDYDTLFLGSSHFYYQVIPSVFDTLTAGSGHPTRSFNAGIAGLRPPEDGYLLDRFLALSRGNLRHVFFELAILRTRLDNADSRRAVYWHDWRRMRMIWRATMSELGKKNLSDGIGPVRERLCNLLVHLLLFLRHETNVGRGEIVTARFTALRPAQSANADLGAALDGWIPTNLPEVMQGEMLSRYEREVAERRRQPARKYFGDSISQEALYRMVDAIEKVGAIPVLVVPPTTDTKNFRPIGGGSRFIILDFCDLETFPELYEPGHRLDLTHLNTAGARIFSRLLGKRFLEETARPR